MGASEGEYGMSTQYEQQLNPIVSGVIHHCSIVCSGYAHEGVYRNWAEDENPHCLVAIERDVSPVHTPDQDEHHIFLRVRLEILGTGNSHTDLRTLKHVVGMIRDRLHTDNRLSGACCWITIKDVLYPAVVQEGLAWLESQIVLEAFKTW